MDPEVAVLVERFDLRWDLELNFEPFLAALSRLGVTVDDPDAPGDLDPEDRLAVVRCVLDMADHQYELGIANRWEPVAVSLLVPVEYLAASSAALATLEEQARLRDALGRISFRRGEYITAADRFGEASQLASASPLDFLRADLESNFIRADDERIRLTRPQASGARRARYENGMEASPAVDVALLADREAWTREAVLRARGMSNFYHNLAIVVRGMAASAYRDEHLELARRDWDEALRLHHEAEQINRLLGDRYRLGQTLFNEALVRLDIARHGDGRNSQELARAEMLLEEIRDASQVWQRHRCFALQNLAAIRQEFYGDGAGAASLYREAWELYRQLAGTDARDVAFEEWTLRSWVDVADPEELPQLFEQAYESFLYMRTNLRHVLFRRDYAARVMGVLERGLNQSEDASTAVSYLGGWSTQEIADLPSLMPQIDRALAATSFAELDLEVSEALRVARAEIGALVAEAPSSQAATADLTQPVLKEMMGALHHRRERYLAEIEQVRLDSGPAERWSVARLQGVLPADAGVIAYFWPRQRSYTPRAFVISRSGVWETPLEYDEFNFQTASVPSERLLLRIHARLVAPWLDRVEQMNLRSLYLVPYDGLFRLPIHCAKPDGRSPTLLHDRSRFDRVLYSVSLRALGETLRGGRFGRYGDTVAVGRGLAVLDPAEDMGSSLGDLRATVERFQTAEVLSALVGSTATYHEVLRELQAATWWLHLGHGNVPGSEARSGLRTEVPDETRIGAVLELADGVVEDLDILLRCPTQALRFCLLWACVSAGMEVSAGNEIAGFVRALKARGCGPVAMAYWEVFVAKAAPVLDQVLRSLGRQPAAVDLFPCLRDAVGSAQAATGLNGLRPEKAESGMFAVYV